ATAQKEIVEQEGWFPVSQTTLEDPATAEALPVVSTYEQATEYAVQRYGTPWSNELDQLLSVQVFRAMNQEAEPAEALSAAQAQLVPIAEKSMGGPHAAPQPHGRGARAPQVGGPRGPPRRSHHRSTVHLPAAVRGDALALPDERQDARIHAVR